MANSSGCDYEVFLSFRGPDTRYTFTDFLYTTMIKAGIRAYKDDEELRPGEEIGQELSKAIEQSKISIPIFSKGYASSVWCLKELVQMVKCHKTRGQKIMPIFFNVKPSEVQYQTGDYEKAFLSHENKKRYDKETICEWKAALNVVGALKGWDLQSEGNRPQGELSIKVTQKIFNELKKAYLVVSDHLVSVDRHVDQIMEMIGARTNETRIIGIYGMGGIGKTTIAKIVYNQLSNNFDHCCFLSNIREMSKVKGVEFLQNQLISNILKGTWTNIGNIDEGIKTIKERLSNKIVLLLLDDVDEKIHMDALVGKHDWFGKGSKLIITSRNKDVLNGTEVDESHQVDMLDDNQSLQLFSKHAFRKDYPLDKYIDRSKKARDIAGGLPLALEVIGSLLSCTEEAQWDVTLDKLEKISHSGVRSKLKISYDALNPQQQRMFLDIACLFIGYDKDIVVHFWDESKFRLEENMELLQNMSLVKINEDNEVWMHDQLKVLGREIVCLESDMMSRVWDPKEAIDLLMSHEEKEKVEALCLQFDQKRQYCFTYGDFTRLLNLRFLAVDSSMGNFCAQGRLPWNKLPSNVLPPNVFQENLVLLPRLRWLCWHNIPLIFNLKDFSMTNMVIVDLSQSEITHDWNGWSHMKVIRNLKVLNLTDCRRLERIPNFSDHANLERLILRGCNKLTEIDRSICQLKCLISLDVKNCRNLRMLPDEPSGLEALEELLLDSTLIEKIPNWQGMRNLRIITASDCGRITLPLSNGELANLEYLSLDNCISLKRLPDSIGNWESLIELNISGTGIEELPDSIGNLKNLKVVKMTRSRIRKIPNSLWTMMKLEKIEATDNLLLHVEIGNGIYRSPSLRILELMCAEIHAVPRLPESLISLHLCRLYMKTFPDLSNLINLKGLYLSFIKLAYDVKSYELLEDPMPWWIGKLQKLESLELLSDYVTTLPTDISLLPQLKALDLACSNLRHLPGLPSSLSSLCLYHCESLCSMDLSNLKNLSSLVISSSLISEIGGLDCLKKLQNLQISDLGQVKILPNLCNLNKLRGLQVRICVNLVEIQGELPQSLEELEIYFCGSLHKLPDLSSLGGLQRVDISDCMKLNMEAIHGFARRTRRISGRSHRSTFWS